MAFTDVEMSILAQLSYKDINVDGKAKSLGKVLDDNRDWLKSKLGSSYDQYVDRLIDKVDGSNYKVVASCENKISGFYALAISTPQNEVVVASRGTQMDELNDLLTDGGIGLQVETQQHRDMEAFVYHLEKQGYDGYYFTGHSLGGNLANHGAVSVSDPDKVKGVCTYNAPGFNDAYWILHGWKLGKIKNIKNYQNEYDYISSILKVPGEVIVVESNYDGNHADFTDHSICSYTIDENGYFHKNDSGKKQPQTYVGSAVGGAANAIMTVVFPLVGLSRLIYSKRSPVYVTRDFSDAAKGKLLGIVADVENEKWCDFTDWVGDRWYDFESWIGTLNIRGYIDNVNSYHKKVIDKNNTTAKTINKIFAEVHSVDAGYANSMNSIESTLAEWLRFVNSLSDIVQPGKGRFNGKYISGVLEPVLKDIRKANIKRIKDAIFPEVYGGPVAIPIHRYDLLDEYIKKNPGELSDDEKQAVVEIIGDLKDVVAIFDSLWSVGDEKLGLDLVNVAAWISDSIQYGHFSAISAHFNDVFVNILDTCIELGEDSATLGGALIKIFNGEDSLSVLGLDISGEIKRICASGSVAAYLAKWKTEHTEHYFGKAEVSGSAGIESKNKFGIDKFTDWAEDKLKEKGLFDKEKEEFYLDKDGNEIKKTKDTPTFYDREATIAEAKAEAQARVSVYDGTYNIGENGTISATVGEAEAHASISGGFYVIGADGEKKFSPGVKAEVGASVTVLDAEWEQQWLGDENFGLNTDVGVTVGKAEAKADAGVQFFGEDGKLDFQLGASASAEAIAVEAKGSVGVNVLGGEVGVTGGVNFGVGAHADVGYRDGVFKCDIGASLGVGVSLDIEVDVGGMVDGVCDAAEAVGDFASDAWDSVKDGWNSFWSW